MLSEALRAGGVHYRVSGTDKASVLHAVVDMIQLPEEVDRDFLYQVLLAREALGSTGIGDGIAIPHVRNPIVLHLSRPLVTLSFLDQPVDFGAIDGQPVTTLFTLISPTVRAHLHLLSRLGFALRDPDFKKAVLGQASRDVILEALRRVEISIDAVGASRPKPQGAQSMSD
jgi:PTS system nitrogen regulatory IIA component